MFLKKIFAGCLAGLILFAFTPPAAATLNYTFTSGTEVAVSASSYTASGALSLALSFAPTPGTTLTVVNNTGLPFISGSFNGVPQGATVPLSYNGITYNYIANYYGGNGRSFVLQWPCMGLDEWGNNSSGELGTGDKTNRLTPTAANTGGVLAGKTLLAVAAGHSHSLALTSEGKVYAWGDNFSGELGNNTCVSNSQVPVAVNTDGTLAGKTVVAIAQGGCNMALTSEGQVYTWGGNDYGQLGIGDTNTHQSFVPVAVDTSGALAGKTVVAIAAGDFFCLALTSEGKVYAWGYNYEYGMLGIGSTDTGVYYSPVAVTGILENKTVTAIAAGQCHSLALTSEGTVYSWGANDNGQLGNHDDTLPSFEPVAVDTTGALAGKTVIGISAGMRHSLALTSEGLLYSWGVNTYGELGVGDSNTLQSTIPIAVDASGVLAGKVITGISAGESSLAMTSDGQLYAWGANWFGELGTNGTTASYVPTAVSASGDLAGKRVAAIAEGLYHSLALFGADAPSVTLQPASQTGTAGAVLTFTAAAAENPSSMIQWQVSPTGPTGTFSDLADNATAATGTLTLSYITMAQDGYAYRAVFTNNAGICTTAAATLTVVNSSFLATFTSGTVVPITATGTAFASGSLTVELDFAPTPGTNLTVISNTSTAFISGRFTNIPQGGTVPLTYNGVTYNYIANYYGGNGRSLVLQWPCIGLDAWGDNNSGQLGNGTTMQSWVPVPVNSSGALAGKSVFAVAAGHEHNLALTSDGQILAWGHNAYGELGNSSTLSSLVPTLVNASGALAGKTVVAIAGGNAYHNLALTSEGQVFCWGLNFSGQLGNYDFQVGSSGTANSSVPVAVNMTGELAGKTVVAIAAGGSFPNYHSLALTSEGRVFGWGDNAYGELGTGDMFYSAVPVAVDTTGALLGKTVVAIAAGADHTLALTSEGQLFAWGDNSYGELGNSGTLSSCVPVAVNASGALSGKTVIAIAAGKNHSLALTAEGQVYAWGANSSGELGDGSTTDRWEPVAVNTSGALSGKTVTALAAGGVDWFGAQSLALTSDGQVYAWGYNCYGQLGNNSSTNSSVPVAVNTAGDLAGRRVTALAAGAYHNLTMAGALPPTVILNPVSKTGTPGTTVSFSAAATGNPAPASIQWQVSTTGTGGSFSNIVGNASATTGTLILSNVTTGQNGYCYRAVFSNVGGNSISATAILTTIITPNLVATFPSGADVAVTMNAPVFISGSLTVVLGFAPSLGTNLTVIKNTSPSFINGRFSNVPQGSTVSLTYNGLSYDYIANYYGGNGRSLVLQSPCMGLAAWGFDWYGQLGNNSQNNNPWPTPTAVSTNSEVLAGKAVLNIAAGGFYNLALTSSGQIFSWGANFSGELGNNSVTDSLLPVAVDVTGVLAGKTVTSISAGNGHSLALTSDGSVVSWGYNSSGQLGNNSTSDSPVPVAVNTSGVLSGKMVTSIAAGSNHSLALTSEGFVYAWGYNGLGMLGRNGVPDVCPVPVAVDTNGALYGKTVVAIAAGETHSLALTSDGLVYAWGDGTSGQLGNNTNTYSQVPVPVDIGGALAGKTVTAIAAGSGHSLALTSDGSVYAWGLNSCGELGNSGTLNSPVPVAVDIAGVLAGKTVAAISAGDEDSLALTSDGLAVAWGKNNYGQLGNGVTGTSTVPVLVNTSGILAGKTVVAIAAGTFHSMLMFGSVPPSYTAWQNQFFTPSQLTHPAICGDTAAPVGDSIPNLMKYALNLNPMSSGVGKLPVTSVVSIGGSNYLTFTYNQAILAANISYIPEVSDDLQTWHSGPEYIRLVSLTNNSDGVTQTVVVQAIQPISPTTSRFIRLSVTK